ncbi:MAG TPA: carboxypeptidase-like regulatory domain-containing protein [Thermoanaerobaculia bacterium]
MVLRTWLLIFVLAVCRGWAAEAPSPGEVTLPLKDYLTLVETVERVEKERQERAERREAPVAEVVSQRVRVALTGDDTADVTSEMEVLVQGAPEKPVTLPVTGVPRQAEVKGPSAALTAGVKTGEWLLVASAPGRYAVRFAGPAALQRQGVSRLVLAPVAAPVSLTEIELPADLAWSAPGSVIVEDRVDGARRTVRLTAKRGESPALEVRRKVDGGEADRLLAQALVLTLVQLQPDGPRRHDVVLYDVSRGGLGALTVDLPPGLVVDQVGTDEGDVVPAVEARRLTVHRRKQLQGVGYLVLTSTPAPGAELALEPLVPEVEVRARFLALSSSVAADVRPLPEPAWDRVDLDDLPSTLRDALGPVDLAAAWRLTGAPPGPRVAVSLLPAATSLPALVRLRETTTLMTVDGTLLHRDRITLRPNGLGSSLDVALPPSATLWSARVGELPVRPLERGGGALSVPLGFETGKDVVVEVVSVMEKAVPAGRAELALSLPRLVAPVQEHRWRLLLPDGHRYRFREGTLRPAAVGTIPRARDPWRILQSTPGVLTDRINVGGNESGQQSQYVGPGGKGLLRGTVVDTQGAALPGVTVTLHGPFAPLTQVTDALGVFRFIGLATGTYTVQADLEGFSSIEAPNIQVSEGATTNIEMTLSAAVEDVITVTAESPLLDERRTGNTQTFDMEDRPSGGGGRRRKPKTEAPAAYYDFDSFTETANSLKEGLVGGVKPLPITIPESGKLLLLTGVLPPAEVGLALEVRAKKD